MGRKALSDKERRRIVGFSIGPATEGWIERIMADGGDRSKGAAIDRIAEAEVKRIERRSKK